MVASSGFLILLAICGATYALAKRNSFDDLTNHVRDHYESRFGQNQPLIFGLLFIAVFLREIPYIMIATVVVALSTMAAIDRQEFRLLNEIHVSQPLINKWKCYTLIGWAFFAVLGGAAMYETLRT